MGGIKEISKMTNLSIATVSRVFNDSSVVKAKTRKKVLKAAKEINYRHNRLAAALRSGKSKTIGIIVPEINNYFFGNVINTIEEELRVKGYSVIISQSHESPIRQEQAIDNLMNLNVDGILVSISKKTEDYSIFNKVQKEGTPIVFFDRLPNLENSNVVMLDDFKGGQLATNHLIENGCNTIVHAYNNSNLFILDQRKEGFLREVENNTKIKNHYLLELTFDREKDIKLVQNLLKKDSKIDGIFANGDKLGVHVMNVLRILGVAVPDQIKLIGFGNIDYTEFTYPRMSTIDQKGEHMGTLIVDMLVDAIDNKSDIYSRQILSPTLIQRESSLISS